MLALPQQTEFNKRIPKQKFYGHINSNAVIKSQFAAQVKTIYWRNKIAASTLNIAAGSMLPELEVFEINLNTPNISESVLRQIDMAIPYYILFLLEHNGRYQAVIAFKEIIESKNIKVNDKMSCCGGVAIVPAKYPFYRAYELAEQLCSSAKKKSRITDEIFIDFAILHGDMSPTLKQLCIQQYEAPEGYLHYGPYCITQEQKDKSSIVDLLSLVEKIKTVPNNKIKDLRNVLNEDNHSIVRFLENCLEIENILKDELQKESITARDLWQYRSNEDILKTRYVDAIELIDFSLKS